MRDQEATLRHVEHVMGTVFSFHVRHSPTAALRIALADAVDDLHRVDATFSPFRPSSVVSRLARGELDKDAVPPQVAEILRLCAQASVRTHGYFDAWLGGSFDPCGVVKGWAVERAADRLRRAGAFDFCVNGGGDLVAGGRGPGGAMWSAGVADPFRTGALAARLEVGNAAVATSGNAERGAHVRDPRTGEPSRGVASATVVGPSLTWADVYATAAVARGVGALPWLAGLPGYELLLITEAGDHYATPRFPLAPGAAHPAGAPSWDGAVR